MATTIEFGNGHAVALAETAATATIGHFATPRLGWSATAGGIVLGAIDHRDDRGGATIAGGISYLALTEGEGARPFVAVSASVGTALIRGVADDGSHRLWSAWDIRGGGIVGKTFARRIVPYLAARAFGGPVFWHFSDTGGATGTDRYHVTAGAGLTVRLPGRVDLTIEAMPLGERSATAGATLHI